MPGPAPVRDIVSLLPSATEIACALGLGDRLAAVTHECDWPVAIAALPHVTQSRIDHAGASSREIDAHVKRSVHEGSSIYALDRALLERLRPALILTQELCDVCAVSYGEVRGAVRRLPGPPAILSLEPTGLAGILDSIAEVARAAGVPERAAPLVESLRARIERVAARAAAASGPRPRVLALEWLDPPFAGGHWVPEMIRLAGGDDVLGREGERSFETDWPRIAAARPDTVVVMPCGFDAERARAELAHTPLPQAWHELSAVRAGRVFAVDASAYFSRPGPRIVDGLEFLAGILR